MGNRLCKRRGSEGDSSEVNKENAVDRIMSRLCLRPNSWTTDLHPNKQVNRSSKSKLCKNEKNVEPLTKSSDWIEASLEVPEKEVSMSFDNSKLEPIFNYSEAGTPVPPPRKQKKGIKEKIEAAAKNGLLALQPRKSIEEPLCIKNKIDYSCPCHDPNHKHNLENNSTVHEKNGVNKKDQKLEKSRKSEREKESKRKKNLSVVSLPNYNDMKFTIANFSDIDGSTSREDHIKASNVSLPQEKVGGSKSYMVRCRSFGSLLPQQLLEKLKPTPIVAPSVESDDSFGALEDWDLDLIEHYNPRDASLPRPRRTIPKNETKILSDIENQIMKEEIENSDQSPKKLPQANSTETLLMSDTSPVLGTINPSYSHGGETLSLNSMDIYDSIEDYANNSRTILREETSDNGKEEKTHTSDNKNSDEAVCDKRTIHKIVERFIESEKMCVNTS